MCKKGDTNSEMVNGRELQGRESTLYRERQKVRDDRTDSVKYWLIVLVIAGHVFLRKEFADSTACVVTWKWIYIFHMPLFVSVRNMSKFG